MKIQPVKRENIQFEYYSINTIITNETELLQFVSQSNYSYEEYLPIFNLLIDNRYITNEVVDYIPNFYINNFKYDIDVNNYNFSEQDKITYSVIVPEDVVKNTSLPMKYMLSNTQNENRLQYYFSNYFYRNKLVNTRANDYNNLSKIKNKILKTYSNDEPNIYPFLLQVVEPSNLMYRYLIKNFNGFEVIIPPSDIMTTSVYNDNNSIKIELQKNIISDYQHYGCQVYPTPINAEFMATYLNQPGNISKLIMTVDTTDMNNLLDRNIDYFIMMNGRKFPIEYYPHNGRTYRTESNITNSQYIYEQTGQWCDNFNSPYPFDILPVYALSFQGNQLFIGNSWIKKEYNYPLHFHFENSKVLKFNVNYPKSLGVNFQLNNKLGYYNSLIPNELGLAPLRIKIENNEYKILEPTVYSYSIKLYNEQNDISGSSSFKYKLLNQPLYSLNKDSENYFGISRFNNMMFDNNKYVNICSIIYNQQNTQFLYEPTKYKISFDIELYGIKKNNSIINKVPNTNSIIARILPYNGIQENDQYLNNDNIGLYPNLVINPMYLNKDKQLLQIGSFYKIINNYNSQSLQQIYANNYSASNYYIKDNKLFVYDNIPISPKDNYNQYNFMYDKYGQFLTYRTLNKQYYQYNNKRYIDLFNNIIEYSCSNTDQNWYHIEYIIQKNFQGNALLSIMYNITLNQIYGQQPSKLYINNYENKMILKIENIHIVKLNYE